MHIAATRTLILSLHSKATSYGQRESGFLAPTFTCKSPFLLQKQTRQGAGVNVRRKGLKYLPALCAVSSEVGNCYVHFEDFSVISSMNGVRDQKISIEVSGSKTQMIFDDVFEKMVDAAQPIPGFRRVKGGKTPNIPKDILLEILGPSNVFKELIKKIINSTVAEYVQREGLKVSKSLRVEQSFEDLESIFKAGQKFNFDAVIELQKVC